MSTAGILRRARSPLSDRRRIAAAPGREFCALLQCGRLLLARCRPQPIRRHVRSWWQRDIRALSKGSLFDPGCVKTRKKTQKVILRSVLGPNQISFSHSLDPYAT
jgi:hypothetical protein